MKFGEEFKKEIIIYGKTIFKSTVEFLNELDVDPDKMLLGDEKITLTEYIESLKTPIKFDTSYTLEDIKAGKPGVEGVIYFVKSSEEQEYDQSEEYIYVNGKWERIGSTSINLQDYTKEISTSETINADKGFTVGDKNVLTEKEDNSTTLQTILNTLSLSGSTISTTDNITTSGSLSSASLKVSSKNVLTEEVANSTEKQDLINDVTYNKTNLVISTDSTVESSKGFKSNNKNVLYETSANLTDKQTIIDSLSIDGDALYYESYEYGQEIVKDISELTYLENGKIYQLDLSSATTVTIPTIFVQSDNNVDYKSSFIPTIELHIKTGDTVPTIKWTDTVLWTDQTSYKEPTWAAKSTYIVILKTLGGLSDKVIGNVKLSLLNTNL